MDERVIQRLTKLRGHIGLYYKSLTDGEEYGYHADDGYNPASTIKLPIMAEVYRQAAAGQVRMSDTVRVLEKDKVPGCGALRYFPGEPEVTLDTLCHLMITISDNTATNTLIRHFGGEKLTEGFRIFGMAKTSVRRCFYDYELESRGVNNVIIPRETGALLEKIALGTFVNPGVSEEIREILLDQQITHKLERLPEDMKAAHKTGEDTGITNEIALIYGPEPFVFCFYSNEADVPECNDFIRYATWLLAGGEGQAL